MIFVLLPVSVWVLLSEKGSATSGGRSLLLFIYLPLAVYSHSFWLICIKDLFVAASLLIYLPKSRSTTSSRRSPSGTRTTNSYASSISASS
ncbi:uncharacterized protein EV420DRAFT_1540091 [Desarmillaria tabescens]|uniref:Uncharacterized protein n=1 Tax=Armillaria tabescens TaxID=1929756 RepID=A0AA39MK78_ARMTA|nr:uncharacterized protein EV420DRAFT_1587056 [Desarmillaria tabescens]XP_060331640.1 uncharacterized protein EV420DRAFT_1540091 [Desarmillaria tabescens]KAK0437941.1 hypothetical protein EV420DRAFT_1587056 [Desarmillaria tabescens]KAK0459414.1 hypothetical protein EV420DRAFT_1540091 [Desarmillaria tabescens]